MGTSKNRKMDHQIVTLLKDKDSNEKEIKERDKTIHEKEQRIYDLKKQNQELEKFKFVLDYKIKELKAQIDPKNDDIAEMKKQIQAMDSDLEDYHKKNKQLQINIEQLQSKQRTLQEDIEKQELDADIQLEYNRQREYLEKSVESLKRKLLKDSEVHRQDNMRILQENVALIREINDLRLEINHLKHERQQQRLDVSKMKSTARRSGPLVESQQDVSLANELEANRVQIAELRGEIELQASLREDAVAAEVKALAAETTMVEETTVAVTQNMAEDNTVNVVSGIDSDAELRSPHAAASDGGLSEPASPV